MLEKKEFAILRDVAQNEGISQRSLVKTTGLSLGTVHSSVQDLTTNGLIEDVNHARSGNSASLVITKAGWDVLEHYRVDNAVILAAGLSSRFAPISYEKPKGLLKVRGEVLVERQIRQLQEVGITDITIVTGYKKEQYFYLEDMFGVKIVVNQDYAVRNNQSSLMAVADVLANTYICSSDDYFLENPFSTYEWKAYYAAQFAEGVTEEWCVKTGVGQRITSVTIGGDNAWYMIGHAYFDRAFSCQFVEILRAEYDFPETYGKLWEQIYVEHIKELEMFLKPYPEGMIIEFDSLDQLRNFDPEFIQNVDSAVFSNIEKVLECNRRDITDIYPLKQGITNLSCHFRVGDEEYVYRHPGVGTDALVDRASETEMQEIAKQLELDDTFIFEDAKAGWKISSFISDCRTPDVKDTKQLRAMMHMAKKLHTTDFFVAKLFDFYQESKRYEGLLGGRSAIDIAGYAEMAAKIDKLHQYVDTDGNGRLCLSHNDFWPCNILLDEADKMYLIDWEYAGMSDYASDFGTFVVESELTEEEAERALEFYFERKPTPVELMHNFAYVAFAGWCWYIWALYKEYRGEIVGEWLHIYYSYAKKYLTLALEMYENAEALKTAC